MSIKQKNYYKLKNIKGITLIALIITIIILLILVGVTMAQLTESGLFEKAKLSADKSKYANIKENLILALNSSYDENGVLNDNLLKENLNKIDGIEPKITEVTYDLTVIISGYKFEISKNGTIIEIEKDNDEIDTALLENPYNKENLLVFLDGQDAPVDGIWKDRSGNNNDAIMSGKYLHDTTNKSYTFFEEEGQGKISKFDYTEGVTISACLEILSYTNSEQYILIGNGYLGPSNRPSLGINANNIKLFDSTKEVTTQSQLEEEKRYTITVTIDKEGMGRIYINNELISTNDLDMSFPMTPSNDFRIHGYGTTTNEDYFDYSKLSGNIYNVLVYDRALSEEEVQDIYEININRYKENEETIEPYYTEEDLLVYLDGEDAPVDGIWKDRSGNNNDAIMSGTYSYDSTNKEYIFSEEEGQGKISKFSYTKGLTISARVKIDVASTSELYIGNGYRGPTQMRPTIIFSSNKIGMIGGQYRRKYLFI